jgi:cell division protein FtsB
VVLAPEAHSGDRLQTVEAMLRDRQRAFLELVSTTETLRRAVAKLQDELAEKDAEIARLRLQAIA